MSSPTLGRPGERESSKKAVLGYQAGIVTTAGPHPVSSSPPAREPHIFPFFTDGDPGTDQQRRLPASGRARLCGLLLQNLGTTRHRSHLTVTVIIIIIIIPAAAAGFIYSAYRSEPPYPLFKAFSLHLSLTSVLVTSPL